MRLIGKGCLALGIALWILWSLVAVPLEALAQTPITVRVAPAVVQVGTSATVDVAIEVVDVQELYGFDVTVTFDPQVVEVVDADPAAPGLQVAQGTFLDSGFAVINTADNTEGNAHLVMTQLNPSLPKSGTGALVVIRLRGKQAGTGSALTVENPQLARRDGLLIAATGLAGRVQVVAGAATTQAPIPTQGAGTPMAEATPEAPAQPAATATGSDVVAATATIEPATAPDTPTAEPTTPPATAAQTVASATLAPTDTPPATQTDPAAQAPAATAEPAGATAGPPTVVPPATTTPSSAAVAVVAATPVAKMISSAPEPPAESRAVEEEPSSLLANFDTVVAITVVAVALAAGAVWVRRRSAGRS